MYMIDIFSIIYINIKVKETKQTKYIMDKLILSILIFIQREFRHFEYFSDIYIIILKINVE